MRLTSVALVEDGTAVFVGEARGRAPVDAFHASPTRSPPVVELTHGASVGRFVVLDRLGEGTTGIVCKAYDPALRRELALKLLKSHAVEGEADARLVAEAQAMAQLSHPNVVAIYDVTVHDGTVVLAMEYVPGQTLRGWLDARAQRRWTEILDVFLQAGHGLAAAHRAGLVHRDFKPANVLLSDEGRVLVTDFGIAAGLDVEAGAVAMGTPKYMAPEQHQGLQVDGRSDQYAYCVTLWEALCGASPVSGSGAEALAAAKHQGPPAWPKHVRVPRSVLAALRRGLAAEPEQRWPTMDALLGVLTTTRQRRHTLAWLASAPVFAVTAAGLWAWQTERAQQCSGAHEALRDVWDDARRDAVRTALLATGRGYAADTWTRVETSLDGYAEAWAGEHRSACEATVVEQTQPVTVMDRRMACLHRRKAELDAVVDVLTTADAQVLEKAVTMTVGLPSVSRCGNIEALLAEVPPPDDPEDAAKVEQARALLTEAKAERNAARYDSARAKLDAAEALVKDLEYPPVQAEVALETGELFDEAGQYEASEAVLSRALPLALASNSGETATRIAQVLAHVVGVRRVRTHEGHWVAEQAVELARTANDGGKLESTARNILGLVLKTQGRYDEAEAQFQEALALGENSVPAGHPWLADFRTNLALVLDAKGDHVSAEREQRQVLASRQQIYGPEHPKVADSHLNLGGVLRMRGQLVAAEAEYRRALALREQAFGDEHPAVLRSHNNLAILLQMQGRYAEAEAKHRHVLAIVQRTLGPDHPSVADSRNNLANVLGAQGRREDALLELRQALQIYEKVLGPAHLNVADTRYNMAVHWLQQKRSDLAKIEAERAIEGYQKVFGRDHSRLANARHLLASLLTAEGDLEAAEAENRQALAMAERTMSAGHPHVANMHHTLGELLLLRGRNKEGRRFLERAWEIRSGDNAPLDQRAHTAFALAKEIWKSRSERARAVELATTAVQSYRDAGPGFDDLRREAELWLQARGKRAKKR